MIGVIMASAITAEDIKEIRTSYGLSQKSFATLLGIGVASIVRYEQGATPTKANANLIRAARNPQFMIECLEQDGDLIPAAQRRHAEEIVYDYISFDSEENARMHEGLDAAGLPPTRSMDEVYHFTLQQEILNEQAANLIGDLMRHLLYIDENHETADESLEILLNELFSVKRSILSVDSDSDTYLEQIRGYLTFQKKYVAAICSCEKAA